MLKLWPLLYMHAKVHENAVNAMLTCSYKWPTNNVCVSAMKLTYSSQDLLFHSKSIHIRRFQFNHTYTSGTVAPSRRLA